jgi:hypothetical protein
MSLTVRSSGRGRSKSPGRRERSPSISSSSSEEEEYDYRRERDRDRTSERDRTKSSTVSKSSSKYYDDRDSRNGRDYKRDVSPLRERLDDRKSSASSKSYRDEKDYKRAISPRPSERDEHRSSHYKEKHSSSRHGNVSESSSSEEESDRSYERRKSKSSKYETSSTKEDKYRDSKYREDKYSEDKYKKDKYEKDKYEKDKYEKEKYDKVKYEEDKYREKKYKEDKYREEKHHSPERSSKYSKKRSPSPRGRKLKHEESSSSSSTESSRSPSSNRTESKKYVYDAKAKSTSGSKELKLSYEKDEIKPSRKHSTDTKVVELRPGGSISGGGSLLAPDGKTSRRLSVGNHSLTLMTSHSSHGSSVGGGLPPGSPLLEAYHGTYQSISPMPSPIALPPAVELEMSKFRLDGSDSDGGLSDGSVYNRRSRIRHGLYDPIPDTKDLVEAINGKTVKASILIDILPRLNHDQLLAVRVEYKKRCKYKGLGINIAKHIKTKMTGSFGKACYVTALGRWESEAYWLSFLYNPNNSRRELLIEALMGRSNSEIHELKSVFKDKRYNDSIEKCMKQELKVDKFRAAVLLVLEEKRQEESKYVSGDSVSSDVKLLRGSMNSGGSESIMIQIVLTRSDTQLRAILAEYERIYRENFAREVIKRSTNLVVCFIVIPNFFSASSRARFVNKLLNIGRSTRSCTQWRNQ